MKVNTNQSACIADAFQLDGISTILQQVRYGNSFTRISSDYNPESLYQHPLQARLVGVPPVECLATARTLQPILRAACKQSSPRIGVHEFLRYHAQEAQRESIESLGEEKKQAALQSAFCGRANFRHTKANLLILPSQARRTGESIQ